MPAETAPSRTTTYSPMMTMIVAATAVATRRTIITTDTNARCADLPGVDSLAVC